jgi:uncharacterized protein involved in exopolysaccharide biosynthesis
MVAATIVILGIALSIVLALLMRPVYRAEVVLLPSTDESAVGDLAALAGQFGPLAALTGVSMGARGSRDEALGILRSRSLLEKFVTERNLMPILFSKEWDADVNDWRDDLGRKPTMGDAILMFEREIRQVREDIKSGLVTLRVEWFDRELAAEWANGMVAIANEELRSRSIAEASSALAALEQELARAEAVELRSALSRLIEGQLKARTMAAVRKEYAFKVIDPARVPDPDKRARPTRTLVVLGGALASALLSVFVCLWLDRGRTGVALSRDSSK